MNLSTKMPGRTVFEREGVLRTTFMTPSIEPSVIA